MEFISRRNAFHKCYSPVSLPADIHSTRRAISAPRIPFNQQGNGFLFEIEILKIFLHTIN